MKFYTKNEFVNIFFLYIFAAILIAVVSLINLSQALYLAHNRDKESSIKKTTVLFDKKAFENIQVIGKAYVVYDLKQNEIIAAKNESAILPLASITKIMTALSATLHKEKEGKIIITKESLKNGTDLGLVNKQVWTLPELLKYTLVFSSNDGAEAIAESFGGKDTFVNQMNADAKALGLSLIFTDPAGLDTNGEIGGKGTVVEVARLLGIARTSFPEILDATTKKRVSVSASTGAIIGIPNTNQGIQELSGAEASKTGFTDLAGGNLGVIVDVSLGHPVAIIILGSTREGRFKDVTLLYNTLRKSMQEDISSGTSK